MAEETWSRRELVILELIVAAEESGDLRAPRAKFDATAIALRLGLTDEDATIGIGALVDADYLVAADMNASGGGRFFRVRGITEKARRAVGQWPSGDPLAALLALLDARIGQTPDPVEKSKLVALRDAALGVGEGIATSILTELIRRQTGL